MRRIYLPTSYNYIGVFLTFRCNMNCSYCINEYGELKGCSELTAKDWIEGLNRIKTRSNLPITLQGGEPTIHEEFYKIVKGIKGRMDLLTNGLFDLETFVNEVDRRVFMRPSKYASIRFSFHEHTSPAGLVMKVYEMKKMGYSVGIWGLNCFDMEEKNKWMRDACRWLGIDYREKEFLSKEMGNYRYPDAVTGLKEMKVECRPSELLIAPDGNIFRCHSDLYAGVNSRGNILDNKVVVTDEFLPCNRYGLCNPCDVKIKNNRFQEWGHTSVEIKHG